MLSSCGTPPCAYASDTSDGTSDDTSDDSSDDTSPSKDIVMYFSKSAHRPFGTGAQEFRRSQLAQLAQREPHALDAVPDWRRKLSNFHTDPAGVLVDMHGLTWTSVESAYQCTVMATIDSHVYGLDLVETLMQYHGKHDGRTAPATLKMQASVLRARSASLAIAYPTVEEFVTRRYMHDVAFQNILSLTGDAIIRHWTRGATVGSDLGGGGAHLMYLRDEVASSRPV